MPGGLRLSEIGEVHFGIVEHLEPHIFNDSQVKTLALIVFPSLILALCSFHNDLLNLK